MRFIPSGKQVCKFTLATTETFGKDQKVTQWHNIEVWGWNAEYTGECIRKGDEVIVIGKVAYESWDGKDGNKVYRTKVVAEVIRATVTRTNKTSNGGSGPAKNNKQQQSSQSQPQDTGYEPYNQGGSDW